MIVNLRTLRETLTQQGEWLDGIQNARSLEGFIVEHGTEYEWSPRPDDVEPGRLKECYTNATHLALERSWLYVEGYVYSRAIGIPVHHAWCLTDDGSVVDPTLREEDDTDCGFCLGGGTIEVAIEWDDDGEEDGWREEDCGECGGTGTDHDQGINRVGTVYIGVALPIEKVTEAILKKGHYGLVEILPELVETAKISSDGE